jgi:hypothetical protein
VPGFAGLGGGGAGGNADSYSYGGGVGLYGEGPSGNAASPGSAGSVQYGNAAYGGGGTPEVSPRSGACRIIWGATCSYPHNAGPSCAG